MNNRKSKDKLGCFLYCGSLCLGIPYIVNLSTATFSLSFSLPYVHNSTHSYSHVTTVVSSILTSINITIFMMFILCQASYISSARKKQAEKSAEITRLERIISGRPQPILIIPQHTDNQPPTYSENQDEQGRLLTRDALPNYQATDTAFTAST